MGCAGGHCGKAGCPNLFMDEWAHCWGEVFRIYRALGTGAVRVGDLVGIYYPREPGKWLGCAGQTCGKATCPGHPTSAYGFSHHEHWYRCYGEVFKIYARGRNNGDIIRHEDDIALYYVQAGDWVSHSSSSIYRNPCIGNNRPPSYNLYDRCWGEIFKIWKRYI